MKIFPKLICPLSQHLFQDIKAYCIRYWKIKHALIIFILFFPIHSICLLQCNFQWKNAFCNNKELQLKNNLLLFPATFTQNLFSKLFGGYAWKNGNRMNGNSGPKFRVLLNGKINFTPTLLLSVSMLCKFPLSTLLIRDVDLIRWKNIEKFPRNLFYAESNFSSLKMFYSATENEHLTNWDRIQWQLTQFVNQFPLHALNIRCCCDSTSFMTRPERGRTEWRSDNCCFSRSHQYFISFP